MSIRIIRKEVGKSAEITMTEKENLVDYHRIFAHPKYKNVMVICKENYRRKLLPATIDFPELKKTVGGKCFIVAVNKDGGFMSLTNRQATRVLADLRNREINYSDMTVEFFSALSKALKEAKTTKTKSKELEL